MQAPPSVRDIGAGFFILLCLMGVRCDFSNPEAPSWDVNFVIPLIHKTYTVQKMVEENAEVRIKEDGGVYYRIEQEIDRVEIGAHLKLGDHSQETRVPVGPDLGTVRVLSDTIAMFNQIIVETGELRQGRLNIEVENRSSKQVTIQIDVPALTLREAAASFEALIPVAAGQNSGVINHDLSGSHYKPEIRGGRNRIPYRLALRFPEGAPQSMEEIVIRASVQGLLLQRFRGGLNHFSMPLSSPKSALDLPEQLDGIRLGRTDGALSMFSHINNVPMDINLVLAGGREDGRADSISIRIRELQGGIDEHNPANWQEYPVEHLQNLINLYPDYLSITGHASIGNGYDPDHPLDITYTDAIRGKLTIDVPLTFDIRPGMITETGVDTLDLNEDTRDAIRNNLNEAALVVVSENHLPLGATVTLIFSRMRGDSTLYTETHPTDVVKELNLQPAQTGGGSGTEHNPNHVTSSRTGAMEFRMTTQDLALFDSPDVYFGMRLEFPGTPGMVRVMPDDYITIQARMEASVHSKIPKKDAEKGGGP